jgi:hypothetical protein
VVVMMPMIMMLPPLTPMTLHDRGLTDALPPPLVRRFIYYIVPTHYTLEGLVMTQFYGDDTPIKAVVGKATTPAYEYMVRTRRSLFAVGKGRYHIALLKDCTFPRSCTFSFTLGRAPDSRGLALRGLPVSTLTV